MPYTVTFPVTGSGPFATTKEGAENAISDVIESLNTDLTAKQDVFVDESVASWGVTDQNGNATLWMEGPDTDFRIRNTWLDALVAKIGINSTLSIAVFGDSRVDDVSNGNRTHTIGFIYWLQLLTDSRFDFETADNFGIGGDTSAQVLARIDDVLASDAEIVIAIASTNDRSTLDAAASIANLQVIQDTLLSAGKIVIWFAELPRGDADDASQALSGSALSNHMQMRRWLLAQSRVSGIYVADPWPLVADPDSVNGYARTGMLKDSIHTGPIGALQMARTLQPIIEHLIPPISRGPSCAADIFDSDNPRGALVDNPMMGGTSGTIGAGGSGDLAIDWTATITSGITAVFSKVTVDGETWQQVVVSGTPASGTTAVTLSADVSPADLTDGDLIEAVGQVAFESGHSNLRGIPVRWQSFDSGSGSLAMAGHAHIQNVTDINLDLPDLDLSGQVVTPPATVGAGTTSASVSVLIVGAAGAAISATVRFRAVSAHKVIEG